ncbi:MAG TPA: anti-sigma factor [Polyangiaceae bacterium]|nr:anti-sigma factor [Polyangiaceae bacterium]
MSFASPDPAPHAAPASPELDAWDGPLLRAGERFLGALARPLDDADPGGLVRGPSRLLCSALGLVSQLCYGACGGRDEADEVGLAGAQLALLTKLDDEVIDAPAFHGAGRWPGRARLRAKVLAYLEPTRLSLRAGRPATAEPRARFAASLGARFAALAASPARLGHLLDVVEEGFRVQADAVAILSAPPAAVSLGEVADVTARISGAWLLMIALAGTLPRDARPLSPEAEALFYAWGWHVQRADALCDLAKDLGDGLGSTYPLRLLWAHDAALYRRSLASGPAEVYRQLGAFGFDRACLPEPGEIEALARRSARLGALPSLFRWVQGMLAHRYARHRLARPSARFDGGEGAASFDRFVAGVGGAPCSAR